MNRQYISAVKPLSDHVLQVDFVSGSRLLLDMKPYLELSESTLYTILKRLELAKMLTVRTSEHGGRLRKYYHITQAGLRRLEEFKEEWREVMSIYQFVIREDAKK